jgi:hypothetical protein
MCPIEKKINVIPNPQSAYFLLSSDDPFNLEAKKANVNGRVNKASIMIGVVISKVRHVTQ